MRLIRLIGPIRHIGLRLKQAGKRLLIAFLALIVVGLPLLYLSILNAGKVSAAWYDDNWAYRQRIPIDTHTASETNVYNEMTVDTATLTTDKLQADCDDLRFTKENGELLPYQIVSGCDTATTTIRVGFDTMPVAPFNIYMYYGNPSASAGSTTLTHSACGNGCAEGSPASEEKAPGPVAYWKFDEGTGTSANDSTKGGNTGTLSGTTKPTWQTEDMCISGKCLYFNGSTAYVDAGDVLDSVFVGTSAKFTAQAWFYTNSTAQQLIIAKHKWSTSDREWLLQYVNQQFAAALTNPGDTVSITTTTTATYATNQWVHVAMVVDFTQSAAADKLKVYVNGVQVAQTTATVGSLTTLTDGAAKLLIGNGNDGAGTQWLNGKVDEVKIYPYARSLAQIATDYASRGSVKGASALLGGGRTDSPEVGGLSNGLIGYWKMDESSWATNCSTESVTDSSGNSNSGEACPNASTPSPGAGKFGNGGVLDGTNDYINVDDAASLDITSAITLSAWVKTSATNNYSGIINKYAANNTGYSMSFNTAGGVRADFGNGTTYIVPTSTTNVEDGNWHLVVATYDGTTAKIYVDGVVGSGQPTGTGFLTANNNSLLIGNDACCGSLRYFNGRIDEVRIYNRTLTPAEITALYNFAPGPSGYWKMDENSGTTTNDSSGNSNTSSAFTGNVAWTQGKYGSGLSFDGTDDVVRVVETASTDVGATTSSYTVSAWLKTATNYSGNATVLAKDDGSGAYPFELYLNSSEYACFQISDGTNAPSACGSTALNDGKWHYLTGARDVSADKIYIYVDGVTINNTTDTTTATAANNDDESLGNAGTSYTANDFNGQIDDAKVYNYARTAKQITEDMNAGHPAVGSPVGTAVGYWKFDEGFGTTANNSGSGSQTLQGSLSGMASPATSTSGWTNSGKFGKALLFDGTNDYVAMPSDVSALKITSDITLSAWINLTNTSSTHDIICKYTGTAATSAYCLYTDTNGKLNMSVVNETGPAIVTTTGTTTLSASTWYYVTGVFSSANSVTLYINGAQDKQNTTSIPTTLQNPTTILDIGAENAGSNPFIGTIDEPKIYNYALTTDQVKLDMNRSSAQILGALSDSTSYQLQAANQEYCIPGDSTSCTAPVGEWKFDENKGSSAFDTSGNANTGTWNGTLGSQWKPGKIGTAGNFNGSNNYIDITSPTNLNFERTDTFSISAWIKPTSGADWVAIYGKSTQSNSWRGIRFLVLNTGNLRVDMVNTWGAGGQNAIRETTTGVNVEDGGWHYVTLTYDGSSSSNGLKFYVDGKEATTTVDYNTLSATILTSLTPKIGASNAGTSDAISNLYSGLLDQMRIYNYVRTPAQIAYDYNRGAPVGHWKFDECQGTTAYDSSTNGNGASNGNTGTITPGSGGQTAVGTCTGSAGTLWKDGATGKYNSSLDFDGTDDYVVTGSFSPLAASGQTTTKVSWGGWFYPTTSAASKTPMVKATEFRIITNSSSQATCGIYYSAAFNNSTAASPALTLNAWNHLVCTYDGSNIKTYINGKLADTTANTNSITAASSAFYIGSSSTPDQYFSGQIDDVKIYNYALTATQVKSLYNDGAVRFGPSTGSP